MNVDAEPHGAGGDEPPWEQLYERAAKIVDDIIRSLPPNLREQAEKLPCLFEKWPDDELADDTLGTYTGFEQGSVSEHNGPIVLFLGSIYEYCNEEEGEFDAEVRMTYLHEFGHHLGWDETDLEDRGLL